MTDWIMAIGTLLIGFAATMALFFGPREVQKYQAGIQERKLKLDETEHHRIYKFDLAKRSVNMFGEAKWAFIDIRNNSKRLDEIKKSRELALEGFGDDVAKFDHIKPYLDTQLLYYRSYQHRNLFKDLSKLQPEFLAVFKTEAPFVELRQIYFELYIAANKLDMSSCKGIEVPKEWHDIWGNIDDIDEDAERRILYRSELDLVGERINKSVKEVNDICFPVLRGGDDAEKSDNPAELSRWLLFLRRWFLFWRKNQ